MSKPASNSTRPLIATLVSLGGTVILVVTLALNLGFNIPVDELEKRCIAAYQASEYPQFKVPKYVFVFHGRGERIYETNAARMRVIDTLNYDILPESEMKITLTCKAKPNNKVSLQMWKR